MKNILLLFIGFFVLFSTTANNEGEDVDNFYLKGTTTIFSTSDLYELVTKWADEFCNIYKAVKIEVVKESGTSTTDILKGDGKFGFISTGYNNGLHGQSFWKVVVGRDIIVPVINSKNPFLEEIYQQGVSTNVLVEFLKNPDDRNWGELLKNNLKTQVNYYLVDDPSIKAGLARFIDIDETSIKGIRVADVNELISSVKRDPYAIGFCKMVDIVDKVNHSLIEDVKLMPLDRNGNGKIDHMENMYKDISDFSRGVWIGKYPVQLYNKIYAISLNKPDNRIEIEFVKWILTEGQQFLHSAGYAELEIFERQAKADMISGNNMKMGPPVNNFNYSRRIGFFIAINVIVLLLVMVMVQFIKYRGVSGYETRSAVPVAFDISSINIPGGLYYDKTHTWAFMEKDGLVKIGIDDFLLHVTGPLTRIKMKKIGEKIKKGELLVSVIQDGKQINLYAPLSGTIKAQNNNLSSNTYLLNSSPYSDGWVYAIEPENWQRETQFLIRAEKYKVWLKEEFSRFKDFLSEFIKTDEKEYAQVVLQNGGAIKDNVLSNFGPHIWEDFQTGFIDITR